MQLKFLAPGVSLALAVALVPAAALAKPEPPVQPPTGATAVTIQAKPGIEVFGGATVLSGRVSGAKGGVVIRLQEDDSRPYGDSYKAAEATTTTANNGAYTLSVKPLLNTQYRAVAQAAPPVTSAATLVRVRILVGVNLSDATPRRGSLVRFTGTAMSAHDGRIVSIQKRSPTGRFITVSRTTLHDAGDARSTYSRRLRVSRDGVYRVKVAGDADHINGFSRVRAVRVHG